MGVVGEVRSPLPSAELECFRVGRGGTVIERQAADEAGGGGAFEAGASVVSGILEGGECSESSKVMAREAIPTEA